MKILSMNINCETNNIKTPTLPKVIGKLNTILIKIQFEFFGGSYS